MSRVLRNDPRGFASTRTRERIVAAAEKIGYRANAAARGLRSSRTMALGLLLPGFTSPVYSAIVHGSRPAPKSTGTAWCSEHTPRVIHTRP